MTSSWIPPKTLFSKHMKSAGQDNPMDFFSLPCVCEVETFIYCPPGACVFAV